MPIILHLHTPAQYTPSHAITLYHTPSHAITRYHTQSHSITLYHTLPQDTLTECTALPLTLCGGVPYRPYGRVPYRGNNCKHQSCVNSSSWAWVNSLSLAEDFGDSRRQQKNRAPTKEKRAKKGNKCAPTNTCGPTAFLVAALFPCKFSALCQKFEHRNLCNKNFLGDTILP